MATFQEENLELIFGRRSIRRYSPEEVSEQLVQKVLEAAMAAPSAMAKDPWRFVVIRAQMMLSRLAEVLPGGQMLASARLGIAVAGDKGAALDGHLSFLLQDCAACIENLLLGAHVVRLGACWVGVHPNEKAMSKVKELLSLPTPIVPIAVVALGHPAENPGPRTRFNREYVHFEKWSGS